MRKTLHYKPLLFVLMVACFGCRPLQVLTHPDPFDKPFYDKARMIMTEDEIRIYKSLAGEDSKKEFITEFWRIRDPFPETEENENKLEFQRRILFANEWFDQHRRRRRDFDAENARGWQTDKGRMYLVFGPPDRVNYGEGWGPLKKFPPHDAIYESWYYSAYRLTLFFERERIETKTESDPRRETGENEPAISNISVSSITGSGGWRLVPDLKIMNTIEEAKQKWISPQYRSDVKNGIRFKAKYAGDGLRINIPSDKVIFIDEAGKLSVFLLVAIEVYRGSEKENEIKMNKTLSFPEDDVLELFEVVVEVPYTPAKKGEYHFDVTVTDLKAEYLSKYRQIIKHVF